jgi:hypothetical protein
VTDNFEWQEYISWMFCGSRCTNKSSVGMFPQVQWTHYSAYAILTETKGRLLSNFSLAFSLYPEGCKCHCGYLCWKTHITKLFILFPLAQWSLGFRKGQKLSGSRAKPKALGSCVMAHRCFGQLSSVVSNECRAHKQDDNEPSISDMILTWFDGMVSPVDAMHAWRIYSSWLTPFCHIHAYGSDRILCREKNRDCAIVVCLCFIFW